MPLHPTVAKLLAASAHLPRPPNITVEAARLAMCERIRLLPPATETLRSVTDLRLPSSAQAHGLPARLYLPADASADTALLYFHGGGWVLGDLETHDGICRRLCARTPCAVLAVDYRLAPEHPFPAPAEDCWNALQWLRRELPALNMRRIAVGGDSAGATLAAATALRNRDSGAPALHAMALIYPATAHYSAQTASYSELAQGYGLTSEAMIWFWDHYLQNPAYQRDPYAVPHTAGSHAGLPPTLILTAEYDVLRDEAEQYAQLLSAAGVCVRQQRFAGMHHGFAALSGIVDEADRALAEASQWLRTPG